MTKGRNSAPVTVRLPDSVYTKLKATAAARGECVNDLLTRAIRNELYGPRSWLSSFLWTLRRTRNRSR